MQHTLQVKVLDPRWGTEWPLPAYATDAPTMAEVA